MGLFGTDPAVMLRLREIERKLDLIMQALEIRLPASSSAAVDDDVQILIRTGRKIEAIKRYRELTGVGLAEAKAYVETLER